MIKDTHRKWKNAIEKILLQGINIRRRKSTDGVKSSLSRIGTFTRTVHVMISDLRSILRIRES
ncbi:hypothetical protein [Sporolactobacillus sp. KGMB 08714]|uniref:hypothetical protein n=1 Tax=Sporolactobacillus sp. KGMB 08714 TaxID=3064704 RepID=UPI002FBD6248